MLAIFVVSVATVSGAYALGPSLLGPANEEVKNALANGDYNAFVALMQDRIPETITEERFNMLAGRFATHEAMMTAVENEDYDAWTSAISDEYPRKATSLTQDDFQQMIDRHASMEEIRLAIENRDYDAWLEAQSNLQFGSKFTQLITEDEFDTFVDMHNAKMNGDFDTAKELAEQLDLDGFRNGFSKHGNPHGKVGFMHGECMGAGA